MNYEDHGQCLPTSVRGARGACGRGARATPIFLKVQKKKPVTLLRLQIGNELCTEVQYGAGAFRRTNISKHEVQ